MKHAVKYANVTISDASRQALIELDPIGALAGPLRYMTTKHGAGIIAVLLVWAGTDYADARKALAGSKYPQCILKTQQGTVAGHVP
jgi:hypothetical protein